MAKSQLDSHGPNRSGIRVRRSRPHTSRAFEGSRSMICTPTPPARTRESLYATHVDSSYHTFTYILHINDFPKQCEIHFIPYTMGSLWNSISHSRINHFVILSIPFRNSHGGEFEYAFISHFHGINHTQLKLSKYEFITKFTKFSNNPPHEWNWPRRREMKFGKFKRSKPA